MTETYFDIACNVLNLSHEDLRNRINMSHDNSDLMIKQAWERINPRTEEEIIKFYTEHIEYTLFHIRLSSHIDKNYLDASLFNKLKNHLQDIEQLCILDYGCGTGHTALSLINSGCKNVILADIPTPLFNITKRMVSPYIGEDKFINIIEKHPLKNNYDLIICIDVFEHVKDPDQLLKHLISHCRYIYIDTFFDGWQHHPVHLKENFDKFYHIWKDIIKSYGLRPIFLNNKRESDGLFSTR